MNMSGYNITKYQIKERYVYETMDCSGGGVDYGTGFIRLFRECGDHPQ
jgi:hypothetical protein